MTNVYQTLAYQQTIQHLMDSVVNPPTIGTGQNMPPTPPPVPSGLTSLQINALDEAQYSAPMKKKTKGNRLYNLPLMKAFSYQLRGKKIDGEIGLEIECEGTHLFDSPIQYWQTHTDGSLRAVEGHPPIEYTLRKPLSREDIPKALTYLSKKLEAAGSSVVESTRTSVHVHLNCQDLSLKQIYQIWCLYAIFEEILIDFSGTDRVGNLFCLSGKQAEYNVWLLETSIQSENFTELLSENLRYTSCNFASLSKFGSLEFRSMRGTVDQTLIQTWIDILIRIKDEALKYDNPREIVKDFQELGPQRFIRKIFRQREDIQQIFFDREYHQSLWDGLRMMRDVAYAVKWQRYDPSLEKKEPIREDSVLPESLTNDVVVLSTLVTNPTEGILWAVRIINKAINLPSPIWLTKYESDDTDVAWLENYSDTSRGFRFGNAPANSWSIQSRRRFKVNLQTHAHIPTPIVNYIEEDELAPDQY